MEELDWIRLLQRLLAQRIQEGKILPSKFTAFQHQIIQRVRREI